MLSRGERMNDLFEAVLLRYGREIIINGIAEARAFLQPVTDRSKAASYTVTSLGTVDDRLWICLGTRAMNPGDTVICGADRFTVRSGEPVYLGAELNHWWAVLTAEQEAAE